MLRTQYTPLAGQGINLGLADVGVLADEIEQATSAQVDWGDLAVLRRYQRSSENRKFGDNGSHGRL